jgi:hypothetical protein
MKVVAYVPDLMDRSRISGAGGAEVEFVSSPAALPDRGASADLVIVDLGRPGVLEVLPQVTAPTVGFGSHVDRDLLAAGRAAGCEQVLARSAFFAGLSSVLRGAGGGGRREGGGREDRPGR